MRWRPDLSCIKPYAQAFGWGLLGVGAFAPFTWWPLGILCWAGLYLLLRQAGSLKHALGLGFAFGCSQFLDGVSWVYVSMHDIGGMPTALALLATILFAAYLALYPMLAAGLFRLMHTDAEKSLQSHDNVIARPSQSSPLLFAACWTFCEILRGTLFTGFPWLNLGYTGTPPNPLAGYAPIIGAYGLSFLTAWLAGLMAELWQHYRTHNWQWSSTFNRTATLFATIILAGIGFGQISWTHPEGAPIKVSLLQGNIAQSMKWQPEQYIQTLLTYFQLARNNPATLLVLPETAIPSLLSEAPTEFLADLQRIAQEQHGNILVGVPTGGSDQGYSWYANSAVSMGIDPTQTYSKVHLVPFGETTPPGFAWFLKLIQMPLPDFTAGSATQPLMQLNHQRIAINICYEDIFGGAIARRARDATLLVNLSNTAWFGDSLAQPQHFQIAQIRALENGRPMLRATNTGMTGVIGAHGERQAVLAAFTRNALVSNVQGMQGTTPFQRWFNWPVVGLCLLLLGWGLLSRRQRAR